MSRHAAHETFEVSFDSLILIPQTKFEDRDTTRDDKKKKKKNKSAVSSLSFGKRTIRNRASNEMPNE